MVRRFFIHRNTQGLSAIERWERAGLHDLNNDEQVLLRARARSSLSLFEVREVLDHQRVGRGPPRRPEVRRVILDRGLAARAVQLIYRLVPRATHFHRGLSPLLVLTTSGVHASGSPHRNRAPPGRPDRSGPLRNWLPDNLRHLPGQHRGHRLARQTRSWPPSTRSLAGHLQLRAGFAECRAILDAIPAVQPEDLSSEESDEGFAEARVWFADENIGHVETVGGRSVLGRVLLGQSSPLARPGDGSRAARHLAAPA